MKLNKFLALVPYRIPINITILQNTARDMLREAKDVESLAQFLGWEADTDVLVEGFAPVKNAKHLGKLVKENRERTILKARRVAKGFTKMSTPRTGLKGWFQKKFHDPKEMKLPVTEDIYSWVAALPRYALLVSMHDALLAYCSSAEPRRMDVEEMTEFTDPLANAITRHLQGEVDRFQTALNQPLKNIDPSVLIAHFPGYVLKFEQDNSIAYYYGERFE
ncbi:MAG: hypothetical protein AAFY98_02975 [Verrucomicrobiota bacterium]